MHVYLREEQVRLRMEAVEGGGAFVPPGSELVPMAFYVDDNESPSFRALLPPQTVGALQEALLRPVTLGLLAEEPEDASEEIRAMVGLAVPISEGDLEEREGEEEAEPWREKASSDAWRGEDSPGYEEAEPSRTALLAFAPLIRLTRRFPGDFVEELADLLETALTGATRPSLEARVDRLLNDL